MRSSANNIGLFVAGTDTEVGKTVVTAGLVALARQRGMKACAVKPVETGCRERDGTLYAEDGEFLRMASEELIHSKDCVPYRFALPASPARAAEAEGSRIRPVELIDHVMRIAGKVQFLAVEGAGGLMVPISEKFLMMDLVQKLNYPVVLAARTRLGTINHTLLSVEALLRRGIEVRSVVLSRSSMIAGPEEEFTASDIAAQIDPIPVLVLPYLVKETLGAPDRIARSMTEAWSASTIDHLLLG